MQVQIKYNSLMEHEPLNKTNAVWRITESLWRLTFWAFHVGWCGVIHPVQPVPWAVKTKQIPPTEVRNVHRMEVDGNILLSDNNQQNDHSR